MITHLHPPTSSSPLDLVRDGFSLFVLGSADQLNSIIRAQHWTADISHFNDLAGKIDSGGKGGTRIEE